MLPFRSAATVAGLAALLCTGCPPMQFDGPPGVEAGTGEFAFEAVTDGMEVPIIFGPQGGSHVWLGVRVTNMDPRQLHIESSMFQADTGIPIGSTLFFDVSLVDDGTEVWTAGLPHQVEPGDVSNVLVRMDVVALDRGDRMAMDSMEVTPVFQ